MEGVAATAEADKISAPEVLDEQDGAHGTVSVPPDGDGVQDSEPGEGERAGDSWDSNVSELDSARGLLDAEKETVGSCSFSKASDEQDQEEGLVKGGGETAGSRWDSNTLGHDDVEALAETQGPLGHEWEGPAVSAGDQQVLDLIQNNLLGEHGGLVGRSMLEAVHSAQGSCMTEEFGASGVRKELKGVLSTQEGGVDEGGNLGGAPSTQGSSMTEGGGLSEGPSTSDETDLSHELGGQCGEGSLLVGPSTSDGLDLSNIVAADQEGEGLQGPGQGGGFVLSDLLGEEDGKGFSREGGKGSFAWQEDFASPNMGVLSAPATSEELSFKGVARDMDASDLNTTALEDRLEQTTAALEKKDRQCETWKRRAEQLQARLTAAESQLAEERMIKSKIVDSQLSHPSIKAAMEAVKHELAHSKRDYSNSRALNKELQAQIDALLGSNAALDAMQKGKAELEMENSFLKQRMGVLETTSRSSRSGDDAASADGEARLLGSRRLNQALEVVMDPTAIQHVSEEASFLGSRRLGALASIFQLPGAQPHRRPYSQAVFEDDDAEIVT